MRVILIPFISLNLNSSDRVVEPHGLRVDSCATRATDAAEEEGFEKVRLARSVVAGHDRHAFAQLDLRAFVAAKVPYVESPDNHAGKQRLSGLRC